MSNSSSSSITEFDRVERVGAEIIDERRFRRDFLAIDAQIIGDDVGHAFHYRGRTLSVLLQAVQCLLDW